MKLAQEAPRALRDDGFDGVGHVFGAQQLGGILGSARGKFRRDAARANHADANAMFPEIFRHASGETDNTPFGGAINAAAGEGAFARQGADIDDVARAAADHRRRHRPREEKDTFEIGGHYPIPIALGFFMRRAKQADAGIVDEDGDETERSFRLRNQIRNVQFLRVLGRTP